MVRSAVGGWRTLGGVREGPEVGLIAELGELGEETVDLCLRRALVEMVLSKIPEHPRANKARVSGLLDRCGLSGSPVQSITLRSDDLPPFQTRAEGWTRECRHRAVRRQERQFLSR